MKYHPDVVREYIRNMYEDYLDADIDPKSGTVHMRTVTGRDMRFPIAGVERAIDATRQRKASVVGLY